MKKRFFIIGFLVVLLIAIPITVYVLKYNTKGASSKAAASTVLSATTATTTVGVGVSVPVDIIIDPGSNAVSVIKLNLSYDSTKLSTSAGGLVPNAATFPTILDPVTYGSCTGNFCTITATLAIGADPTKAITTKIKAGTITFKTLATTDQGPTNITFGTQATAYSVAQADQASENVLASTIPLALIISNNPTGSGTPTVATTTTINPTTTKLPTQATTNPTIATDTGITPTTGTGGTGTGITPTTSATNQPPLCTNLSVDQNIATVGGTINFTANGNSPISSINKVTFNFGDGNIMDITTGGGIGTNNISVQQAHTYPTNGAYTATAILTDNNNLLSDATMCSQSITIGTINPTTTTNTPTTLPKTGPSDILIGIGIGGIALSIIGGLLFFGL